MSGQQVRDLARTYHERGNRYQRAGQIAAAQAHWDAASLLAEAGQSAIAADVVAEGSGLTFSGIGGGR